MRTDTTSDILDPSRRTFDDTVKPLIAEAHDRLARTPRQRETA